MSPNEQSVKRVTLGNVFALVARRHSVILYSSRASGEGGASRLLKTAYSINSSAVPRSDGHGDAERPRGLQVDHEFKFVWVLDGKVGRLGAFQDAIDIGIRAPGQVARVDAV